MQASCSTGHDCVCKSHVVEEEKAKNSHCHNDGLVDCANSVHFCHLFLFINCASGSTVW